MKTFEWFLLIYLILCGLYGCQTIQGIKYINKERITVDRYEHKDKSILFVPMAHVGRPSFYDELADSVKSWKSRGYVVYHEGLIGSQEDLGLEDEEYDVLRKKFRKMWDGMSLDPDENVEHIQAVFKKSVPQPGIEYLGIDSTDVHADISLIEFINEYEKIYGPVDLSDCDLETPMDEQYNCDGLKRKKTKPVVHDYRNELLATRIDTSAHQKIIVTYGASHIKPVKRLLKNK